MSTSPDCCEKLISTITQSIPIPEVIKHIKNAFRERHLADVQNLLRENEMKQEISFLKRKLEENSQENQRKCAEFEEDKRALKINEMQMVNAKDKLILELNGKINELKAKLLVNERLFGVYRDKCKCLDSGIVEDLPVKQVEAEKALEKLKSEILEANKARDELKVKKLESDKLAEMYKTRLENLSPRISRIEMGFADIYTAKFGGQNDGSGNRRSSGLSKKVGHANAAQLVTAKGCFSKIVCSSSAAAAGGDIIEIIDCDDDKNPDGAPDISKGCGGSNVSEKEVSFVRYSSSSQRSKRNRISNLTTKKNTNTGNKAGPESVSPTPVEKFNRSNDSCTDSDDDSCTDSRMDDLIASLPGKTKSTSWSRLARN